jgi:thiol-disulfide isomerase/thioredoxin
MILNREFPSVNEPESRFARSNAMQAAVTRSATVIFAAVAGAVAILWLASASAPASAAPEIGNMAPTLIATELNGQTFDLAKLKGKVVLVNYWATWCAPCKKDTPKLDAFYRSHHQQNLEMIGISVDEARDLAKVRKVMASLAYPVAVLKDVTDNGFGAPEGVPITWIVDAEGKVRDRMIDVRDELLNELVVPLLPH